MSPMVKNIFFEYRQGTEDLTQLRSSWNRFFIFGLLTAAIGVLAVIYSLASTLASIYLLAAFLVASGVLLLGGSFYTRGWGGFALTAFAGILYAMVGIVMFIRPFEATVIYTLILAVSFMAEGVMRGVFSLMSRGFRNWGWALASGVATFLLGVLILFQWPGSSIWVLGTLVGINFAILGSLLMAIGLSLRKLDTPPAMRRAA